MTTLSRHGPVRIMIREWASYGAGVGQASLSWLHTNTHTQIRTHYSRFRLCACVKARVRIGCASHHHALLRCTLLYTEKKNNRPGFHDRAKRVQLGATRIIPALLSALAKIIRTCSLHGRRKSAIFRADTSRVLEVAARETARVFPIISFVGTAVI